MLRKLEKHYGIHPRGTSTPTRPAATAKPHTAGSSRKFAYLTLRLTRIDWFATFFSYSRERQAGFSLPVVCS